MKKYRPLRVSCRIADGNIVSTDGIFPLDAILAAAWIRKHHPEEYYNDGARGSNPIEAELPLAEVETDGYRIYAASIAQYVKYGEWIHYWHKRFREYMAERYLDKLRKINTGSAQYKGYRMPINVNIVGPLTWYCVGDIDGIRDLLSDIRSMGKKRAYGFGQVEIEAGHPAWSVEPWPEDWSVRGPDGRLMRCIPFSGKTITGAVIRHWGVRPPYWVPKNQTICEVPKVGDWDGRDSRRDD